MSGIKVIPQKHINVGKSTPIAQVYGKASGIKPVVDKDRGEVFNSIVGNFEAVNLETGEVYNSGVLYLPSGIHAMVENAANKLAKDSTETVDFALEIRVVQSANKAGYSYEAVNLIPAALVDPIATIRAQITGRPAPVLEAGAAPAEAKDAATATAKVVKSK